ncbi:hypothetical protein [Sinorhizobium medicae]|uniref:Uncharacterized protein n=1 Tax=Sinorhizobium medicae TaxID=110321 RepID=A0A508WWG8_9HYPH|nr:hypothetical protein [Sinorhizobium medicae]VTZ61777.1 conserved hypothetical protein [Sinorhizobium medicae]
MTDQTATAPAATAPAAATAPEAAEAKGKVKKTPVKLLYDVWNEKGERVARGTVLKVPVEDAKRMIKDGKAERADPLPGDAE